MIAKINPINFKSLNNTNSKGTKMEYDNDIKKHKIGVGVLAAGTLVGIPLFFLGKQQVHKIQSAIIGFGSLAALIFEPFYRPKKENYELDNKNFNKVV